MSLKRSCRMQKRIWIFAFLVIMVSMGLTYHALITNDSHFSSFPDKKSVRFLSKFNIQKPVDGADYINDDAVLREGEFGLNMKDRILLSADSKEALRNFLVRLNPDDWKKAEDTDEVALDLKYLLIDNGFESKMSCKEIDNLKLGAPLTYSKSKYVETVDTGSYGRSSRNYGGYQDSYQQSGYNRRQVGQTRMSMTMKSTSEDLNVKVACMREVYDPDFCSNMGNFQ